MRKHGQVDFVELPGQDLSGMKAFYETTLGWNFESSGNASVAFQGEGVSGAISAHPTQAPLEPMLVFYVDDIDEMARKVLAAGGKIIRPIFVCSAGWRFHFRDPGGNDLGVWSDRERSPAVVQRQGLLLKVSTWLRRQPREAIEARRLQAA